MNFVTTVEGPTTEQLKEFIKNSDNYDDKKFAFPTNLSEVLNTVGNSKNNKAVGIDGVSVEAFKTSILVNIFLLIDIPHLSLSRVWFLNCLKDAKAYLLNWVAY